MRYALILAVLAGFATPAAAQMDHGEYAVPAAMADPYTGHQMGTPAAAVDPHAGHTMPLSAPEPVVVPADPHAGHHMAPPAATADPHAGHAMPMNGGADPNAGHDMSGMAHADDAVPAGDPPSPPADWAADAVYPAATMKAVRDRMLAEHGGASFSQLMLNIAEVAPGKGTDGYRWDGEGWFGGDIHRAVLKSEGEGGFGRVLEHAEAQLLYSYALDPYWNMQAGARQDFGDGRSRSYAVLGFEGLAPYWFEVEGALFLSDQGKLFGRVEATYDQRITQRLVAQPRIEFELAAQDALSDRVRSGPTDVELGLRLRHEISREFAPYLGFSWERKLGGTARLARGVGDDVSRGRLVVGVRFWM